MEDNMGRCTFVAMVFSGAGRRGLGGDLSAQSAFMTPITANGRRRLPYVRTAVASISNSASSSINPATTTMVMAGKCLPRTFW